MIIQKRHGAHLPHWTAEGATYSVTFRLWDSLPERVIESWLAERDNILVVARQQHRTLTAHEVRRLDELHEQLDRHLDAGHGACYMRDPAIAALVQEALLFFDGQRYEMFAWCVMPNHVHVLFRPLEGFTASDILQSWKGFTAREANRRVGRRGTFWQAEPYDHLIRDAADFWHHHEYILANPGKAGLRDWPWVGSLLR